MNKVLIGIIILLSMVGCTNVSLTSKNENKLSYGKEVGLLNKRGNSGKFLSNKMIPEKQSIHLTGIEKYLNDFPSPYAKSNFQKFIGSERILEIWEVGLVNSDIKK